MRMKGYSPKELERMALGVGYIFRHCKGTHKVYEKDGVVENLTIPFHQSEVCRPMAKRLVKQIEASV